MKYSDLEDLLRQALGLKITAIGHSTLEMAIKRRMRSLEIAELEAYGKKLKASPGEFKELIEEVVIPETWFFRDQVPFAALTDFVRNKWSHDNPSGILRVLSLPCSTGEEPYSIAMALLQAGWPADKFKITGADISTRAIARAKRAEYSEHSFRGRNIGFRDRFFHKKNDIFILKESVRKNVHFSHGNILSALFIERLGVHDIVFCRNLLIYLDSKYLERTITILDRLLLPGGLLFIGHAEAGLFADSSFITYPYLKAFALLKKTPETEKRLQEALYKSEQSRIQLSRQTAQDGSKVIEPPEKIPETANELETARQMADAGHLEEAVRHCNLHLHENGPDAESYYLLGVIYDSKGDTENAIKSLRKTLYLAPNHIEGLILSSLIAEKTGDHVSAENYKRRILKIQRSKPLQDRMIEG